MEKIIIDDQLKIIIFNPGKIFSIDFIDNYIFSLQNHKKDTSEYVRFANLFSVESVKFTYADFKNIASAFKKFRMYKSEAKGCFYCKDIGIENQAKIFIEKMKPEFNNYFASTKLEECAEYLEINIKALDKYLSQNS